MDRFFGFDLGDAESAIARLYKEDQVVPEMIPVVGEKSFITAYAQQTSGEILIGEKSCYADNVVKRRLRFKSRFLAEPASVAADVKSFAAGVLGELYGNGDIIQNEETSVYVGCPAGWDKNAREHYREIFESTGYPPVKIISESRAAMVSACQSKHLQIGVDILSKPVLVVDIGSSTTDFAYIMGGKEVEMRTAGEVMLGGGLMDEILLEESVADAGIFRKKIQNVFDESEPWRTYAEFAARRLKEKYFSDEEFWRNNKCVESIVLHYNRPVKLTLKMDQTIADKLVNKKLAKLGGRSFREVFTESLRDVKDAITGKQPELIFLTGGVSKLPAIRQWCTKVFPDAVIITATDPEFSVARGLAYCGRIDEDLKEFKEDLDQLVNSNVIEDIVNKHITGLYRGAVDCLVDPIVEKVALPIFERWRSGEISRLSDTDVILQQDIGSFLSEDEARALLAGPITSWLRPVIEELEEYTVPICIKHRVPYTALSLKSYLSVSDIDIKVDAKELFAIKEMTLLIDSIVTALLAILMSTLSFIPFFADPSGIMVGIITSVVILFLGKDKMQEKMLEADIPKAVRKLVPKGAFASRMDNISADVKEAFYKSLEQEKNDEIRTRMVEEISTQIQHTLVKMAEIVEIPLG
ncbi:MAG: Hsp70 family protein [Firmicutes bacterium]|nr:Hsp70 family protein [Bacillota bacterium]